MARKLNDDTMKLQYLTVPDFLVLLKVYEMMLIYADCDIEGQAVSSGGQHRSLFVESEI